ncbi:DUF3052 family protein [Rasiella rasia]|uniref:DUF3052 family protein n=1 Tax=Rasiella rasia TaxID=2744027 RepID=A0A6G6GQC6_9FLAO|nr:DUF3052 family protein [Rasiella rasia]QIE60758.1 DUF3052 family protein [Rasiella rasia]
MTTAGYSGTPLAKKLGIKEGTTMLAVNSPKSYLSFFREFPPNVIMAPVRSTSEDVDFIHVFVKTQADLQTYVSEVMPRLKREGMLWLSWPKKTSGIATELDKFSIMKFGQNLGLVDTKVAAIDEQWSGHKFVYRLQDR